MDQKHNLQTVIKALAVPCRYQYITGFKEAALTVHLVRHNTRKPGLLGARSAFSFLISHPYWGKYLLIWTLKILCQGCLSVVCTFSL